MDLRAMVIHVDAKDRLLVGQYSFESNQKSKKPIPCNGKLLILAPKEQGFAELGTMDVELMPLTIFSSPDGSRAFVSNIFSGTVTIVDMNAMKTETTLGVDTVRRQDKSMHQGAHGLALVT
jgi:DNA-binding beta-propeller fold protein YncE